MDVNAKPDKKPMKMSKYKSPKYGCNQKSMASMPNKMPKMPKFSPLLPNMTEKMAKLTLVAKRLVKNGQTGLVYDWTELAKLESDVRRIDLPVLSRLVCEQRNLDAGLPSNLADLSTIQAPEVDAEPMVSPLTPFQKRHFSVPPPRTGESPSPPDPSNEDVEDVDGAQASDDEVGDERHTVADESQERRIQNLECLTQSLPGSSKKKPKLPYSLRPTPWGQLASPSTFQRQSASDDDEDSALPPLETIPSPKSDLPKTKKPKRVRIDIPENSPSSPIITAKDLKRARAPQTRSQSSKKLKGNLFELFSIINLNFFQLELLALSPTMIGPRNWLVKWLFQALYNVMNLMAISLRKMNLHHNEVYFKKFFFEILLSVQIFIFTFRCLN